MWQWDEFTLGHMQVNILPNENGTVTSIVTWYAQIH